MKLFPLIFIAIVICQVDASTIFGRLTIGRPRRPFSAPDSMNSPCSTPSQLQSNRFFDCLLCYTRPCTTCLTAQLQSLKQCPPCVSPPCPLCANQNHATTQLVKPRPTSLAYRSVRTFQEPSTQEPLSDDCTPLEIESAKEELVHKVAAILPTVCSTPKSSTHELSFHLIDIACLFRGAGVLGFIRHHLPELIDYLRSRYFLSEEGFLGRDEDGNSFVIPYSSRSLCRRYLLEKMSSFMAERAESSPGLQNSQKPRTTLLPEDSSDYQRVTDISRR